MHDREQPGPEIGAGLPESFLEKCAAERVLHKIVCPFAVARQRSRVASQARDLLFDESMKFGQFGLLRSRGSRGFGNLIETLYTHDVRITLFCKKL
jgi:hypothetical protein